MECMVCFEPMDTWNMQQMPGCSHSICISCADRIQANLDNSSDDTYDISDGSSEYSDEDPYFSQASPIELPVDYTIKVSLDGYTITRVNYFDLEGIYDAMQCPYCRQHGPMWYNLDEIRYCVPSHTSEWNTFERKISKGLTFYTMKRYGSTFAFKLLDDRKVLRIMWTEVNHYAFAPTKTHSVNYSDYPIQSKWSKEPRTYTKTKRFTKMIR